MIDPRYANPATVPYPSGYGAQQQQAPLHYHYHHHRRHGGHNKHKHRNDESPISRDESIHKVDHGHHHFHNENAPIGSGYGVPYGAGFGHGGQHPGAFVADSGVHNVKHHRRHHRHNRHHTVDAGNAGVVGEVSSAVPEQLIGQRSSSALSNQEGHARSPAPFVEGDGGQHTHHRHHRRHRRHHHSSEHGSFGQTHQSRHGHAALAAVSAGGYGHINEDLIFIERGDHSPHRQEPPVGYEYKGKIEVQGVHSEFRAHSHGREAAPLPVPQTIVPPASSGPCPPGWQQVVLSAGGSCGPCPTGGSPYTGQTYGATTSSAGYGSYGAGYSLPPNCQYIDFGTGTSTGGTYGTTYQQTSHTGQIHHEHGVEQVPARPKIIEVWQKKTKVEGGEKIHIPTITPRGPDFDFERFRNEILAAIGRIPQGGGRDGGTQTQIHPTPGGETVVEHKRQEGEVRVIVQPIQPVFYMPRQTTETGPAPIIPGPAPVTHITTPASAPHVVYVPRNVYVPVIKPVFVPKERVIVRPQVIHVARPVLVDRPVPVTQRPIIIDRERPVPVPVRAAQGAAQAGGSRIVKEEFVYRDNLPVAYGGRCAEFTGGANYGYVPTHQEQHFAASSAHETSGVYQGEEAGINVNVPTQFQHSQSGSHLNVQSGGGGTGSFHGSYSNLAGVDSAAGLNIDQSSCQQVYEQCIQGATGGLVTGHGNIEILDAAVNPNWQKTDQSTLVRRYGRPAYEIVHKSKEIEQQMYSELRHRTSSGGVVRSASQASYASGTNLGAGGGSFAQY